MFGDNYIYLNNEFDNFQELTQTIASVVCGISVIMPSVIISKMK